MTIPFIRLCLTNPLLFGMCFRFKKKPSKKNVYASELFRLEDPKREVST